MRAPHCSVLSSAKYVCSQVCVSPCPSAPPRTRSYEDGQKPAAAGSVQNASLPFGAGTHEPESSAFQADSTVVHLIAFPHVRVCVCVYARTHAHTRACVHACMHALRTKGLARLRRDCHLCPLVGVLLSLPRSHQKRGRSPSARHALHVFARVVVRILCAFLAHTPSRPVTQGSRTTAEHAARRVCARHARTHLQLEALEAVPGVAAPRQTLAADPRELQPEHDEDARAASPRRADANHCLP